MTSIYRDKAVRLLTAAFALACGAGTATAKEITDLSVPTGLTATPGSGEVRLAWTPYGGFPADCEKNRQIQILRKIGAAAYEEITPANGADSSYTDPGLGEEEYAYRIRARCQVDRGDVHFSAWSDPVTAIIGSAPNCVPSTTVSAELSRSLLWPPNGKLVPVTVSGSVATAEYCPVATTVSYTITDEYSEVEGSGIADVTSGTFSFTVNLEAARRGGDLDGRIYTITVLSSDPGQGTDALVVTVPHDQRKK